MGGWIEGRDRGTDATHERFLGRIKQLIDRYQMKEMIKEVKLRRKGIRRQNRKECGQYG